MSGTALLQLAAPHAAPDTELDAIRRVFGVTQAEIATILGTTPRTVSRWRSTSAAHVAPRPAAARSLRELARLRWLLETELGEDASRRWLSTPNPALRGQAPLDVLLTGDRDRVLGLVVSLGEGGLF
jgi:transcriptional regulator with XRE-family HTH domain